MVWTTTPILMTAVYASMIGLALIAGQQIIESRPGPLGQVLAAAAVAGTMALGHLYVARGPAMDRRGELLSEMCAEIANPSPRIARVCADRPTAGGGQAGTPSRP